MRDTESKPERRGRRAIRIAVAAGVLVAIALAVPPARMYLRWVWLRVSGGATVAERVEQYGPAARERLRPHFDRAGADYPPAGLVLIGIKDRQALEVWARSAEGEVRHVRDYPILAASGTAGPKLREGDQQVPEGVYRVESLNPNSMFHLALRLDYPNEHDRRRAAEDGRTNLGGDIMIHGSNASVGCLAMGDEAAEDLFVLAAETGIENVEVILTPTDFRQTESSTDPPNAPDWVSVVYEDLRVRLQELGP